MDDELIALCKKNDAEGWRKLYDHGFRLAKWCAGKKLPSCGASVHEDIAHETMIVITKKISSLESACACERLIRTVARNKSVDYLRKYKNVKFEEYVEYRGYSDEDLSEESCQEPHGPGSAVQPFSKSPDPEVEETVILALRRSLAKLGDPCRTILRRFYLDNAKHREIAEEMGVQVNQMGTRIGRCLKNLRSIFSTEGVDLEDVL